MRLRLPAAPARQALFSSLLPRANYSSQEASREAAWKWAVWKSLGPPELAASPASGAEPDSAVVGPVGLADGTPRCTVFDDGSPEILKEH